MATITTRSGKGSPLTNNEVDANFTNLNTDKAELSGSTFTGNLNLGDNVKLQLGNQTNGDLQIYHSGSHSFISEQGTGDLYIGASNNIALMNAAFSENKLLATTDGALKLYYNGSEKLATTSSGISVDGSVVADGLTVNSGTTNTVATFTSTDSGAGVTLTDNTGSSNFQTTDANLRIGVDDDNAVANSAIQFRVDGSTKATITDASTRIHNSLMVGATTAPSAALDISQSNTRGAYLRSSTTGSRMHFLDATTASVTTVGIGAEGNNMVLIGGGTELLRLNSSGSSTFTGSVSTGNMTLSGQEIDVSSGDLTLDVAGDINLDAGGGEVFFKDGGTSTGKIRMNDGDLQIRSLISDKDITLEGNDNGAIFEAMRLDMSAAGAATFNSSVAANKIAILATDGVRPNDYVASFQNQEATDNQSFGVSIAAGSTGSDIAFNVVDHDASNVLLRVFGNGATTIGGAATFSNTLEVNNYRYFDGDYNATYYRKANHTLLGYQLHRDNGKSFYEWNSGGTHSYDFQFVSNNSPVLSLATNGNINIPNGSLMVGATTAPSFTTGSGIEIKKNGAATLRLHDEGSGGKVFEISSNDNEGYVLAGYGSGMPMILKTASTTALTLDTSQNATFTGSVTSTGNTTIKDAGVVRLKAAPSGSLYGGGFDVFSVTGSNTSPYTSTTRFGNYGQNEVMVLTGANVNIPNGKLGIGMTTAPVQPLEVNGNIGFSKGTNAERYLLVEGADATWAGDVNIQAGFGSTAAGGGVKLYGHAHTTYSGSVWIGRSAGSSGDIMFGNGGTGPTSASQIQMAIDSSGSVNISGSASGTEQFRVGNSTGGTDFGITVTENSGVVLNSAEGSSARSMTFSTGGSPKMTLTSGGDLLVGTTDTTLWNDNADNYGHNILSNGQYYSSTNGEINAYLNRQNSSGAILAFAKDGSPVGSLGVVGGDDLFIAGGATGLRFDSDTAKIYPTNGSGAVSNGALDIGEVNYRFKDLYLSGGVYLGGTGSANKLDDYEEGTFTPTIIGSGTNPTVAYGTRIGKYTKVGNLVTVYISMQTTSFSGGSGNLLIDALPFTASSDSGGGAPMFYRVNSFTETAPFININTAYALFVGRDNTDASTAWSVMQTSAWTAANPTLTQFTMTYFTS